MDTYQNNSAKKQTGNAATVNMTKTYTQSMPGQFSIKKGLADIESGKEKFEAVRGFGRKCRADIVMNSRLKVVVHAPTVTET